MEPIKEKTIEWLKKEINEAWEKMGDPGDFDYLKKATGENLIYLGRFCALEQVCNRLGIDWTI